LTTFGWFNYNHYKYFDNKYLIPAGDGQISPGKMVRATGFTIYVSLALLIIGAVKIKDFTLILTAPTLKRPTTIDVK